MTDFPPVEDWFPQPSAPFASLAQQVEPEGLEDLIGLSNVNAPPAPPPPPPSPPKSKTIFLPAEEAQTILTGGKRARKSSGAKTAQPKKKKVRKLTSQELEQVVKAAGLDLTSDLPQLLAQATHVKHSALGLASPASPSPSSSSSSSSSSSLATPPTLPVMSPRADRSAFSQFVSSGISLQSAMASPSSAPSPPPVFPHELKEHVCRAFMLTGRHVGPYMQQLLHLPFATEAGQQRWKSGGHAANYDAFVAAHPGQPAEQEKFMAMQFVAMMDAWKSEADYHYTELARMLQQDLQQHRETQLKPFQVHYGIDEVKKSAPPPPAPDPTDTKPPVAPKKKRTSSKKKAKPAPTAPPTESAQQQPPTPAAPPQPTMVHPSVQLKRALLLQQTQTTAS